MYRMMDVRNFSQYDFLFKVGTGKRVHQVAAARAMLVCNHRNNSMMTLVTRLTEIVLKSARPPDQSFCPRPRSGAASFHAKCAARRMKIPGLRFGVLGAETSGTEPLSNLITSNLPTGSDTS